MDGSSPHRHPNPLLEANPVSKLFFWWLNPLLKTGYVRTLEAEDMYNICPEDDSQLLGDRLEQEWDKECKKTKGTKKTPSLIRALFRLFGLRYILLGFILLFVEAVKFVQPLLLGGLIRYFTPDSKVTLSESYLYATGISICTILLAILQHPLYFNVNRIGMKMRVACCSLLYRKTLRLSNNGLRKTTAGHIVNLMSNDVNQFDKTVKFINFMWVGFLEVIAVIAVLVTEIGISTLAGIAVLLLMILLQVGMGELFSKFRQRTLKHTDERVKIMNEIIAGMRIVKMYCWEKPFGDLVAKIRKSELYNARATGYLTAVAEIFTRNGLQLCVYAVILLFYVDIHHFRAKTLYILIGLLNAVCMNVLIFVSLGIRTSIQMNVSINRITNFLLLEELERGELTQEKYNDDKRSDCGVRIDKVFAKWNEALEPWTLRNISATVTEGQLLIVIGHVGAGKSSLLLSILRELPAIKGTVRVKGRVGYVSQQPWVFSASLRQNITFGNEYVQTKYDRIVEACALNVDISLLPNGDRTVLGERGVTLSGGQRARISLARALYMGADVYLLDDPLSAVDANVGKHIFENVIRGILKAKPVVLVTHQIQFLKHASQIIILKKGEIIGSATFDELSNLEKEFSSYLKTNDEKRAISVKSQTNHECRYSNHKLIAVHNSNLVSTKAASHVNGTDANKSPQVVENELQTDIIQQPEEERNTGRVDWRVYLGYFKAGSGLFKLTTLFLLLTVAEASSVACDWWLSYWSNQEEERFAALDADQQIRDDSYNDTNVTLPSVNLQFNIIVYSGVIGNILFVWLLRGMFFYKVAFDSSQKLHDTMFARILKTRMRFFDTNPVGRVLNRFSKDVGHMDDLLPVTFNDFLQCCLRITGVVFVTCAINPWVFIAVLPLCISFFFVRQYFLRTSRHVKRLEGTTRSPVFSHLSASLQGLHTIRAFGVQEKIIKEFDNHQNLHSGAWFLFIATTGWFASKLDWMCAIFLSIVTFSSVFAAESLNAGLVGLSVTYAISLTWVFQWGIRQSAEVENLMVSVERVLEFSKLPLEAPLESEDKKKLPADWPQQGCIFVENANLKYSDDSPVILKDLSFNIKPKEKIGVIGRTGAGKSSLITMLFRLAEPEGKLTIDNVNIKNVGLHDLRKKISIIPQDPVLFTGELRKNLDPFRDTEDNILWNTLAEVQLKDVIKGLPKGLSTEVSEGGMNFSVGQRQLICMARALLQQNKILIVDEATANVDSRTDGLIQTTIREKFNDCTVLTIAHRLNTVIDSDRLMVFDEGRLVEFDVPHLLLQRKSGLLYQLVEQTGNAGAFQLKEAAEDAYTRKVKPTSTPGSVKLTYNNGLAAGKEKKSLVNSLLQSSLAPNTHSKETVERKVSSEETYCNILDNKNSICGVMLEEKPVISTDKRENEYCEQSSAFVEDTHL